MTVTYAVGFGNRGFFPPKYMREARQEIPDTLRSLGYDVLLMPENFTQYGAVGTREEGDLFAQFLGDNVGKHDGIIWTHPNFGDEVGMKRALADAGKRGEKILLHAYPDTLDKMGPEERRDAFCGIVSTMDVLYQMGIPFVKLKPHVVSPSSPRFADNLALFTDICQGKTNDPYVPIAPEPTTGGGNFLDGMVVLALGARTTPFYTTRFGELDAQRNGITVETADLSLVFDKMKKISRDDRRYKDKAVELAAYTDWSRVPERAFDQQVRFAMVMDDYIKEYNPDAIGVRCWTEFQELKGISPCATISYLNHKKIPTACEVDIGNAIAMAAMRRISGDVVTCQDWNNNYNEGPTYDDKFMFMHCGPHDTAWLKPGHYVDTHGILDHSFGKGRGYGCIQGRFESAPMTFASCASENGRLKFYVGSGNVTDDSVPHNYFGGAGVAEIKGLQDVMLHVGHGGYKHHFSLGRGDVAGEMIDKLRQHPGFEVTDMRKAADR